MWYYINMSIRKCIYTNKEADSKDNVLPKSKSGNELHNWANKAPCSRVYKDFKQDRLPTEEEMELNRLFYKLEMARLDVQYYTAKIEELQGKISHEAFEKKDKKEARKKDLEIKQAFIEKEIVEEAEDMMESLIKKKKENKDIWG